MRLATTAAAAALLAAPAFAQGIDMSAFTGDPAAGEEVFNRQCATCHVVVTPEGETLAGRSSKTGPNQYGLAYSLIGHQEDFNYSDAILQLHEAGERWTEDKFVGYVQDPTPWLREATGDPRARGKMAYKVRSRGGRPRPLGLLRLDQPRADRRRARSLRGGAPGDQLGSSPGPTAGSPRPRVPDQRGARAEMAAAGARRTRRHGSTGARPPIPSRSDEEPPDRGSPSRARRRRRGAAAIAVLPPPC